jgi:hypothetical protein
MRTFLQISTVTLTALVHIASIAVALGAIAAIYSQSIGTGLLATLAALIAGVSAFSYSVWKIHQPVLGRHPAG